MTRVLAKYSSVRQGAAPGSSSDWSSSGSTLRPVPEVASAVASGCGRMPTVLFTAEVAVAQWQGFLARQVQSARCATDHRLGRRRLPLARGAAIAAAPLHGSPHHVANDREQQEKDYASHQARCSRTSRTKRLPT